MLRRGIAWRAAPPAQGAGRPTTSFPLRNIMHFGNAPLGRRAAICATSGRAAKTFLSEAVAGSHERRSAKRIRVNARQETRVPIRFYRIGTLDVRSQTLTAQSSLREGRMCYGAKSFHFQLQALKLVQRYSATIRMRIRCREGVDIRGGEGAIRRCGFPKSETPEIAAPSCDRP